MLKLYRMNSKGQIRFVDYGVRGLEKTYKALGYLIYTEKEIKIK